MLEIIAELGLLNPRVFGSVARGEDHQDSDIDVLVDLPAGEDVLACEELAQQLAPLLGRVDVTTPPLLRRAIREAVLAEAVPL